MQEFSLLYPQGVEPDCKTLCEEAVNDLSLELICEKLADDTFEHNIIKNIMIFFAIMGIYPENDRFICSKSPWFL